MNEQLRESRREIGHERDTKAPITIMQLESGERKREFVKKEKK